MWPFKKRRSAVSNTTAAARDTTSEIARLLESWRTRTLESEDGDPLTIELSAPASPEDIRHWRDDHSLTMPAELADLLRYTNGASLFGLDLLALDSTYDYGGLIPFHDWGNGDHDCVDADGRVFFTNHNPDARAVIAGSLIEWLRAAMEEIASRGCLHHPMDYKQPSPPPPGLYAPVLDALKDTDCELNG